MARPKDLSKAQTEMVTLTNLQPDGAFALVNNNGEQIGDGRARVSRNHPGYVTLVMSVYTPAIRVPADWLGQFAEREN